MNIKSSCFYLVLLSIMQFESTLAGSAGVDLLYTKLQQQGVVYFSEVRADSDKYDWKMLVHRNKGGHYLSVFDQESNKLVFQYSHQGPLDGFVYHKIIDWNGYPPLIASVWRRGAHGEQFILLDPLNKKILYQITSTWPLSAYVCNKSIAITVSRDTDAQGNPVLETHNWHSPEYVEIYKGGRHGCASNKLPKTIPPIDDSSQSPSLSKFLIKFDAVVKNKDFDAIKKFISKNILNSFGGEGGLNEFVLTWKNDQKGLFDTLTQIRKGGGKLTREKNGTEFYCFPRMFTDFPSDLNAFSHGVLIGKEVRVYASPDVKSIVIAKLSHSVVGVENWVWKKNSWQEIKLKQGVRGYVKSDKIRSPVDYRACFVKNKKGQWSMTQLIAGD